MLTVATAAVGAVGAGAVVWPFLASLKPSARAEAAGAPTLINIGALASGQQMSATWRGRAIWVIKRTNDMLDSLTKVEAQLKDKDSASSEQPSYAKNAARAIKPEIMVLVGSCTHLGCVPSYRPEKSAPDIAANWEGGFYCPCHGSKFDLAGRVLNGSPAPTNLVVPPYRFANDVTVVIGEDQA
jgi:ubiquinol-cytochrome c reductase iron-sulfur subunit